MVSFNRNIETNLIELSSHAIDAIENDKQLDVFYADIQKAFDTVNQSLLIRKLAKFPVSNQTLRWFTSYFANRKQYVRINGEISELFDVTSSVGQGSILGPLLFLIFFDDSDNDIGTSIPLNFADDKKLLKKISNADDTHELQNSINKFIQWCNKNDLQLNTSKCKILTITLKRKPIIHDYAINGVNVERVSEMRDLGVIIDSKLSFSSHIEYISNKSKAALSFVKRTCRNKFSLDSAKLLYCSLVRSNLEFASVVWQPYYKIHRSQVESVQKQAVIYLLGDYMNRAENDFVLAPYVERCAELELKSLIRRRVNASVLFLHKIISGRYNDPAIRGNLDLNLGIRTIRNPEFIRLKNYKKNVGLYSSLNLACTAFNITALYVDPTLPFIDFRRKLLNLPDEVFGGLLSLSERASTTTS